MSIEKGSPITIERVANGFIVTPAARSPVVAMCSDHTLVFNDLGLSSLQGDSLLKFISDHFRTAAQIGDKP